MFHKGPGSQRMLQVMWATCVYIEAVSVLPQLRMMQNAKVGPGPAAASWPVQRSLAAFGPSMLTGSTAG